MNNTSLKILSLLIVLCTVVGLCSCSLGSKEDSGIVTTLRAVTTANNQKKDEKTTAAVLNAEAPKGNENILKYYNDAFKIFRNRRLDFTKVNSTVLSSLSVGTLGTVTGATDSYRATLKSAFSDMMGVNSLTSTFYAGDDISSAFPFKELTAENVSSYSAKADKNKVTVELAIAQITDEGSTTAALVSSDYMTVDKFNQKIKDYGATAASTSLSVKNVKVKITVDESTKNFTEITVTFDTVCTANEINLDYVSGGPVSGSTKTTITYKDFVEE